MSEHFYSFNTSTPSNLRHACQKMRTLPAVELLLIVSIFHSRLCFLSFSLHSHKRQRGDAVLKQRKRESSILPRDGVGEMLDDKLEKRGERNV